jgi:AcrR family transcriptional regulator
MTRTYNLKRRAEQQAETRLRIVEAAIDLHASVGPARTSFSMVAERAGVQRHTLYAHFPDERSLSLACSGLSMERHPPPLADELRSIADRWERLHVGLVKMYNWYGRNADLLACVLRDAEIHDVTREIVDLRMGEGMRAYHAVLGAGLGSRQRALLSLALSFQTWRNLVRESGLSSDEAACTMCCAVIQASPHAPHDEQ